MTTRNNPLDLREVSAILAGLRLVQQWQDRLSHGDVEDILTAGGEVAPLRAEEIDELCVNINCGKVVVL